MFASNSFMLVDSLGHSMTGGLYFGSFGGFYVQFWNDMIYAIWWLSGMFGGVSVV